MAGFCCFMFYRWRRDGADRDVVTGADRSAECCGDVAKCVAGEHGAVEWHDDDQAGLLGAEFHQDDVNLVPGADGRAECGADHLAWRFAREHGAE